MAQPNYRQLARQKATHYGLDPNIFERQINAESGFNPSARSPAGALGIAQIMPSTAKGWGVNPSDPAASLDAAARNMAQYVQKYGSYKNALVAYNAGPARVGGPLPAETQAYVQKILGGSNPKSAPSGGYGLSKSAGKLSTAPSTDNRTALALSLLGEGGGGLTSVLGGVSSAYGVDPLQLAITAALNRGQQAPANYATPQRGTIHGAVGGSPIAGEKAHAATHQTEGLPGYPAYDYMAKAGTPVVAPVSGKIVRFSGHDPKVGPTQGPHGPFGWSIYLQGNDGRSYYLTHLGARDVHVGQTVKQGSVIGAVGNYAKYGTPSHVHMGVH